MNQVEAREVLVGAWRLVSWENRAADGQVTHPMGPMPSAMCSTPPTGASRSPSRGWAGLGSPPAICSAGAAEEQARTVAGFVVYAGRYSFHGDA